MSNVIPPTTTGDFEQTALKLSQGPLGIIALFIVLIHGFASLVLGFSQQLEQGNRTILVWFIVLFPVFVFSVFAWLVSTRHQKLYPPTAYRNEDIFRDLAYGRAAFDQQTSAVNRPAEIASNKGFLKTDAAGNLYWLGHDLMWTADTLLRQGPVEHVVIGLDQAIHHLRCVGLSATPIENDLQTLRAQIRSAQELSAAARDESAKKIGQLIDKIGATLEAAQGNFQLPPHWSRVRA